MRSDLANERIVFHADDRASRCKSPRAGRTHAAALAMPGSSTGAGMSARPQVLPRSSSGKATTDVPGLREQLGPDRSDGRLTFDYTIDDRAIRPVVVRGAGQDTISRDASAFSIRPTSPTARADH